MTRPDTAETAEIAGTANTTALDRPGRITREPPVEEPTPGSFDSREADTLASPSGALRSEQRVRTRVAAILIGGTGLIGITTIPITDGHPVAAKVFAAVLITIVGSTAALWLAGGRRPVLDLEGAAVGLSGSAASVVGIAGLVYWGPTSQVPMAFSLVLFIFASTTRLAWAFAAYAILAVGHLVLIGLILFGVMDDIGIHRVFNLTGPQQRTAIVFYQLVILTSFVVARSTRRSRLRAMTELDRAVRNVAVRDVLLREARQELELRIGGPGVFTGHTVGSFELGEVIGRGGMGEVYRGTHVETGEQAAVKLLQRASLADPEHVKRFVREAAIAASLDPANVVRVLEVSDEESPIPYLAMELLPGRDLATELREREALPIDEIVAMIGDVANGLEAARQAGIVHRDLKPRNLFVTEGKPRVWKILDFGVSKLAGDGDTLTAGNVVGTPGYMAPEQALGERVDYRADVYALATIAYRCITGQPAFAGRDPSVVMHAVIYRMPLRPSRLADVSRQVEHVLAIGMAKSREDRFESARQLADALRDAVAGTLDPAISARAKSLLARLPWRRPETAVL